MLRYSKFLNPAADLLRFRKFSYPEPRHFTPVKRLPEKEKGLYRPFLLDIFHRELFRRPVHPPQIVAMERFPDFPSGFSVVQVKVVNAGSPVFAGVVSEANRAPAVGHELHGSMDPGFVVVKVNGEAVHLKVFIKRESVFAFHDVDVPHFHCHFLILL